jgi:hypothetical protein
LARPRCPEWSDDHPDDDRFLANLRDAVRDLDESCATALPTQAALDKWHEKVFAAIVPVRDYAGNVRQVDPTRPCLDYPVCLRNRLTGEIVASGFPPAHVPRACEELFRVVQTALAELEANWDNLAPVDRFRRLVYVIGSAKGRFVQIHPYVNGNGRSSRALRRSLVRRYGIPDHLAVEKRPPDPYGPHMAEAMRGNFAPYVVELLTQLAALGPPRSPGTR